MGDMMRHMLQQDANEMSEYMGASLLGDMQAWTNSLTNKVANSAHHSKQHSKRASTNIYATNRDSSSNQLANNSSGKIISKKERQYKSTYLVIN